MLFRPRLSAIRHLPLAGFLCAVLCSFAAAEEPRVKAEGTVTVLHDIPYREPSPDEPQSDRWTADVYVPPQTGTPRTFPTLVWFHGGGITGGDKRSDTEAFGLRFASQGVVVVSAGYRLSPGATFPAYLQDAAAAVAWTKKNIAAHSGDPSRIFIGGHSAGAYIALMIGLDPKYLRAAGMDLKEISGLLPVSGQTMTHFTVRKERGLPEDQVIADEAAPVHFAGKNAPPFLLLMGDRDWPARLEENAYFQALCRVAGHQAAWLLVVKERDHGGIFHKMIDPQDPGGQAALRFLQDPTAFKL